MTAWRHGALDAARQAPAVSRAAPRVPRVGLPAAGGRPPWPADPDAVRAGAAGMTRMMTRRRRRACAPHAGVREEEEEEAAAAAAA
eukprot:CAMPEP_0172209972 /NCGR_PEP_ID=MMETSP1050-20130122/35455_1 /TAXON_ID=233186 /ORGANISM="Cryptomonas curvata, Strain CCAP979/52" /LENGTH=85 /DNA_ID=CAMNT_0012889995 /DNA_START=45 /DNA_END=299 /DNA_ORIENTATION=-